MRLRRLDLRSLIAIATILAPDVTMSENLRVLECNVVTLELQEEEGTARWQNGTVHKLLPMRDTGARESWVVAHSYDFAVNNDVMEYVVLAVGRAAFFDYDGELLWSDDYCAWR